MSETSIKNTLADLARRIISTCKNLDIPIFYTDDLGQFWDESQKRKNTTDLLYWDQAQGGCDMFIATAKNLGVTIFYLQIRIFSWKEDISEVVYNETSQKSNANTLKILEKAEEYKTYDGFIEELTVAFKHNNIWHIYQEIPDWRDKYLDLVQMADSEIVGDSFEDDALSTADIDKYARELARDPNFANMKKEAMRYTLRKNYPDDFEQIDSYVSDIISTAKGIYDTELRPVKEKKIAEKAKVLLGEGNSRKKTSDTLGISQKALADILERHT